MQTLELCLRLYSKEDARKTGTVKKVEFDKSGKVNVTQNSTS